MPDVSQLISKRPSESGTSTPELLPEPAKKGGSTKRAMKEEDKEGEVSTTPRATPKASSKNTATSTRKTLSSSPSAAAGSARKTNTPQPSKLLQVWPKASSAAGKRPRDRDEGSSELPQISASQPVPQAKRARQAQPPPASQPLPATPSQKKESFVKHAPPSTAKSKPKQKTVMRERCADFWHLDGSVVVQVQNMLFRLHRSRLTQQSQYLATLFHSTDGSAVECDIVDSCPVYVVGNVSVLDFKRLLTALDAGIAYAINPPPFRVLVSLVRAAHALRFETIHSFATHLLRERWPSDLALIHDPIDGDREEVIAEAVETILLAQQCDLPELLKAAYYELLRAPNFGQDPDIYLDAESSDAEDGEAVRMKMATDDDEDNAPPARLAASDLVLLIGAKQALQNEWLALARAPPLPSVFLCPLERPIRAEADEETQRALKDCTKARSRAEKTWLPQLLQNGVFEAGLADAFAGIRALVDMDWRGMGYCVGCASERQDAWNEKREKLWKKLDVLLQLEDDDDS